MRILVLAFLWAGTCLGQFPEDAVILETSEQGETLLLAGKERELDVPREPASTFKTVIAWAALDRGLVKDIEAPLHGRMEIICVWRCRNPSIRPSIFWQWSWGGRC